MVIFIKNLLEMQLEISTHGIYDIWDRFKITGGRIQVWWGTYKTK